MPPPGELGRTSGAGAEGRRYCPGGGGSRSESPWAPALEVLMFPLSMTQLREDRGAHSSFGVTLRQPPGSACGQDSLLGPHPIPSQGTQSGAETPPSGPSIQGFATRWSRRSSGCSLFPPGGVRFSASPRGNAHGAGQPRGAGVIRAARNELFLTKSPRVPGSCSRYAGVASTPSAFRGSFLEGGSERGGLET